MWWDFIWKSNQNQSLSLSMALPMKLHPQLILLLYLISVYGDFEKIHSNVWIFDFPCLEPESFLNTFPLIESWTENFRYDAIPQTSSQYFSTNCTSCSKGHISCKDTNVRDYLLLKNLIQFALFALNIEQVDLRRFTSETLPSRALGCDGVAAVEHRHLSQANIKLNFGDNDNDDRRRQGECREICLWKMEVCKKIRLIFLKIMSENLGYDWENVCSHQHMVTAFKYCFFFPFSSPNCITPAPPAPPSLLTTCTKVGEWFVKISNPVLCRINLSKYFHCKNISLQGAAGRVWTIRYTWVVSKSSIFIGNNFLKWRVDSYY